MYCPNLCTVILTYIHAYVVIIQNEWHSRHLFLLYFMCGSWYCFICGVEQLIGVHILQRGHLLLLQLLWFCILFLFRMWWWNLCHVRWSILWDSAADANNLKWQKSADQLFWFDKFLHFYNGPVFLSCVLIPLWINNILWYPHLNYVTPECYDVCFSQIPTNKLHIRHQGAALWEGQLGSRTLSADAGGVWENRDAADCGGGSDRARAQTPSRAASAAGNHLLQTVSGHCFSGVCVDVINSNRCCFSD